MDNINYILISNPIGTYRAYSRNIYVNSFSVIPSIQPGGSRRGDSGLLDNLLVGNKLLGLGRHVDNEGDEDVYEVWM